MSYLWWHLWRESSLDCKLAQCGKSSIAGSVLLQQTQALTRWENNLLVKWKLSYLSCDFPQCSSGDNIMIFLDISTYFVVTKHCQKSLDSQQNFDLLFWYKVFQVSKFRHAVPKGAIFIICMDKKWQFSLNLCSENVLL